VSDSEGAHAEAGSLGVPAASKPTIGRLLYLGPAIAAFDRFSIAPLLVPIALEFHMSLAVIASAATFYYLLFGLTQPIYGILSDRFGRVLVIRCSLLAALVGCLASAVAPSAFWLIAARALSGAAMAAVIPTSLVFVADSVPYLQRQRAITNVSASIAVGQALGIVDSGVLATYISWSAPFVVTAIVSGCLVLAMRTLTERPRAASAGAVAQLRKVWAVGWARFVIVLALADGAIFQGLTTYFAPALQSRGVTAAMAGLVVAGFGVGTLAASFVVRRLAVGRSAPMLIAAGAVMLTGGYLVATAVPRPVGILVASLLAGAAYAFLHSSLQTWATEVVPDARGTATALFAASLFVGAACAVGVAAGLADRHSYSTIFLAGAALTVVVGGVAVVAIRRYQQALHS
jgi:predicted MFS family arabinose efflux permease